MRRLLGAALLSGGGLALGLGAVWDLRRRIAALEAFSAALGLLERELALRAPATPELLELLSRQAQAPAGAFFAACGRALEELDRATLAQLWSRELAAVPDLGEEDRRPLAELGTVLGRYGVEAQRQAAAAVRETLEETAGRLAEQRRREGRAYGVLGLSLGLFLAILLL